VQKPRSADLLSKVGGFWIDEVDPILIRSSSVHCNALIESKIVQSALRTISVRLSERATDFDNSIEYG
jgi:hypothetical protein